MHARMDTRSGTRPYSRMLSQHCLATRNTEKKRGRPSNVVYVRDP